MIYHTIRYMRYPEKLNKKDYIGVTAISDGANKEIDFLRMDNAIRNLNSLGYNVVETENARKSVNGRSSSKEERITEFMKLWNDDKVKSILFTTGGDFAFEILEDLDFEKLSKTNPKWIAGYSDITNLGFILTTNYDIATIYGPNYKSYGMKNLHESLLHEIRLMNGEEFVQESFEKCESVEDFVETIDPYEEYNLTKKVEWKSLKGEEKLEFSGRCLGGCFDIIMNLMGTKFDKVSNFINKYKDDGIVWFLETFEASTPQVEINLWKMKNAGYFENCKGIILGRPLFIREDYELNYIDAVKEVLGDLNIPIICDADIGHLAPQMPIINGSILEVKYENGKGKIKNILK